MAFLRGPNLPFKQADATVTCVVTVPERKVSYINLLIDNYATDPALPSELVELLRNVQRQLPKK